MIQYLSLVLDISVLCLTKVKCFFLHLSYLKEILIGFVLSC